MGQLGVAAGGAVAGGIAGSMIPGVGVLLGVQLGFLGGSILGGILFPNKIDAGGPSRDDVRVTSVARGRFIPFGFGTVRLAAQCNWVDEPSFQTQTEEVGGKGSSTEIKTTTMNLSWICGVMEGPVAAITRIWFDGDLVFNILPDNDGAVLSAGLMEALISQDASGLPPSVSFEDGVQIAQSQQFGPIRIYLGGEDQPLEPMLQNDGRISQAFAGLTDPWGNTISTSQNSDFVAPMHGLCMLAFDRVPGDQINNHFPQVEVEALIASTQSFNSIEFDGLTSRSMEHRLPDMITFVQLPSQLDGETFWYEWNVIDKNIDTPIQKKVARESGDEESTIKRNDVGTWNDPRRLVLNQKGTGNTNWFIWSALDGASLHGFTTATGIGGSQPIVMHWYPQADPTHFICTFQTTNDIISVAIADLDTASDLSDVWSRLSDPAITVPGGIDITTASFDEDIATISFIGPDGLFYTVAAEGGSSVFTIVAFDPVTLEIKRAMQPYLSSPANDDPFYSGMGITYDKVTDKIIAIGSDGTLRRIDRDTLTLDDLPDLTGASFGAEDNEDSFRHGPIFGKLWLQLGTNNYGYYDIWNWTGPHCSFSATADGGIAESNNQGPVYDPVNEAVWVRAFFNTDYRAFIRVCREGPVCFPASDVAVEISERCEIDSTLRNTTGWDGKTICGYLVARQVSGRKALEPIAGAINGDFITEDGRVKFILLDSASIKTIPEDDLGAANQIDSQVPGRNITWPYERELPHRVDVVFSDRQLDYDNNTVGFDRPLEDFKGRGKETVQMPIVFDTPSDPQPDEIAERLLYEFDAHRRTHQVQLTWEHIDINVGDAFNYVKGAFTYKVRAEKWALAENNMVVVEARSEDVSVNTASGQAGPQGPVVFEPPTLPHSGTSFFFMIDSSLLRDQDDVTDGIPLYVAAGPGAGNVDDWPGGRLQVSADDGVTWATVATFSADAAATWGNATAALGDASRPHAFDRTNTLAVTMQKGVLPGSVADADLSENRLLNALLVGAPGRWEVVRYATNVNASGSPDDEGDSYTLSLLRRGQRGTSHLVGGHEAGDQVILLEPTKLRKLVLDVADLNVARKYRLVTIGQSPELAAVQDFTLAGETKKPYSLSHVTGSRNPSTGTWTISATRRTRKAGGWVDLIEPPLSEDTEEYECDALSGPGGSVIASKTGLTSPSTTFTAAELGFSPDSDSPFSLTVQWYQVSATVGRGNTEEATVTAPTPAFN